MINNSLDIEKKVFRLRKTFFLIALYLISTRYFIGFLLLINDNYP
jgi:hypothetical protein